MIFKLLFFPLIYPESYIVKSKTKIFSDSPYNLCVIYLLPIHKWLIYGRTLLNAAIVRPAFFRPEGDLGIRKRQKYRLAPAKDIRI